MGTNIRKTVQLDITEDKVGTEANRKAGKSIKFHSRYKKLPLQTVTGLSCSCSNHCSCLSVFFSHVVL